MTAFRCVIAVFLSIAACNERPMDPDPGEGSGGCSPGASASAGTSASSSSSAASSTGSGPAPTACLPCNAMLDNGATPLSKLCIQSQMLWKAVTECACPYSAGFDGHLPGVPVYCDHDPVNNCPFQLATPESSCRQTAAWMCTYSIVDCSKDWARLL